MSWRFSKSRSRSKSGSEIRKSRSRTKSERKRSRSRKRTSRRSLSVSSCISIILPYFRSFPEPLVVQRLRNVAKVIIAKVRAATVLNQSLIEAEVGKLADLIESQKSVSDQSKDKNTNFNTNFRLAAWDAVVRWLQDCDIWFTESLYVPDYSLLYAPDASPSVDYTITLDYSRLYE